MGREESVQVVLNVLAKIYLLDDRNWQRLCSKDRFRYIGRSKSRSSVVLRPERPGHYQLVIAEAQTADEEAAPDGLSATVTLV